MMWKVMMKGTLFHQLQQFNFCLFSHVPPGMVLVTQYQMMGTLARPKRLPGQAGTHPKHRRKGIDPRLKLIKQTIGWQKILQMRTKTKIASQVEEMTQPLANQGMSRNLLVLPMQISLVSTTQLLLVFPPLLAKALEAIDLDLKCQLHWRNPHFHVAPVPCKVECKHI
jgi:hypothetical protein